MKTEILIPSSGVIDLYDDVPISLNYNIANIRTPEKRNADFSKTITVPGSDNNNKLLAHIFEIGVDRLFNPNRKTNAEIVVDKVAVMKGVLRLARINTLQDKRIEYELELKGRIDDLFTAIKDNVLTDIDWTDLNHTWNKTNIINSWSATVGTGYVYPFIDYGIGGQFANTEEVSSFRPATYVKEIIDRIFAFAGFQYSSTFFNTDFFKRLFIPFSSEKFTLNNSTIQSSIFRAHRSSNQSFTYTGINVLVLDTILFNDDSTSPSSDAGNNYNPATGKFTAPVAGIYSFNTQVTIHFKISANPIITTWLHYLRNTNLAAISTQDVFQYVNASMPSGVDHTINFPWTVSLSAGETIEVQLRSSVTDWSPLQSSYIASGSFFLNSLSPDIVLNQSITYSSAVPQNIKMSEFFISIIRMFNLYFEYDKDVPNKIYIEPRNDYYNTTVQDWSEKIDVSQPLLIEPMGALEAKRFIFKYKQDKDWLNEIYQSTFRQVEGESYGIRIKTVDNDFLKNDYDVTKDVIFSPTPQYSDSASDRVYPRIVKTVDNVVSPVNANLRILYYGGLLSCNQWTFYSVATSAPTAHTTYPYCGHISHPSSPVEDLSWGVPKQIYYTPAWAATYSNNNLYNKYWRQFIEEITDKDSSIVTGWFRLTPLDIAMLDFRHIYRFGFQNYRLNKIYDYNPVKEGLTRCEFIKTKTTVPFMYINELLTGGSDVSFEAEPGPSLPPAQGPSGNNPIPPGPRDKVVLGGDNYTPPSGTGILTVGGNNVVGENTKNIVVLASSGNIVSGGMENITILNSSGITVVNNNCTVLQSSGITTTGDNQLWVYNTLLTSGTIWLLSKVKMYSILTADFLGLNTYTPTGEQSLQGLTADIHFAVYGDGGFGGLLKQGTGYKFTSATGTIDMTEYGGPTDLRIHIL